MVTYIQSPSSGTPYWSGIAFVLVLVLISQSAFHRQMHAGLTKEIVDSLLQVVAISSCVDKVRRRARSSTRLGQIMLSCPCIPSE
jgi:hypothetical protein